MLDSSTETTQRIPTLTPQEVGLMMGLGATTIEEGLKQGRFGWGYAVQTGKDRWRYWINKKKFYEIEKVEMR